MKIFDFSPLTKSQKLVLLPTVMMFAGVITFIIGLWGEALIYMVSGGILAIMGMQILTLLAVIKPLRKEDEYTDNVSL